MGAALRLLGRGTFTGRLDWATKPDGVWSSPIAISCIRQTSKAMVDIAKAQQMFTAWNAKG
ncbi:hypothetical protein HaLaN_12544 [Haematococcus lacustris]|uniref:Uncharacterized protein n=1 Tax=Haematococcus lacustris TaxID=44745 RepID=A0A699Z0W5_HAELA|nr:hypothetical protein HaLaN_12544 [Haematococcus lacustris]